MVGEDPHWSVKNALEVKTVKKAKSSWGRGKDSGGKTDLSMLLAP